MSLLLVAFRIAGAILLTALVAVVGVQFVTGHINTKGLVTDKSLDKPSLSPARAQLLASTLAIAAMYAYRVVMNGGSGSLPDIPGGMLMFVGASHATYIGGKLLTLLSGRARFLR